MACVATADRDAHIAQLEGKLGNLHQLAKRASAVLRKHAHSAARLCDDIRSSLGDAAGAAPGGDSDLTDLVSSLPAAAAEACLLYTSPSPRDRG